MSCGVFEMLEIERGRILRMIGLFERVGITSCFAVCVGKMKVQCSLMRSALTTAVNEAL